MMETNPKILLADNSEEFRLLLRRTLEETGEFQIVGDTGDGNEAWELIQQTIAKELPPYEEVYSAMKMTGMPMEPADIGIDAEETHDAFVCSRDMRDRYLASSLLWDLGVLDQFADEIFPV